MRSLACRKRFDDFTLSDDRSGTPAPGGDFHCTARTVPYRLRARRAVLRAGFSPYCQRAKKHAQALLRRDFAATAQSATLLLQKTALACHAQLRPDVSVAVFYAPGFPLAVKEQKRMPSASAPGLCPALQSAAALLLQKTTPECHVQLRPDVSAAIILRAGASPRYQRAKNHTHAPLRQDFVATLQSAAARFPRKPPRHAMRSYDQMHPLSPIARHILPFSASLSAWEARCDRICVQGGGRSPIASSILFRRDGHFAQVLRKSGVLLGTPAANE